MIFEEFKALVDKKIGSKTTEQVREDFSKLFGYTFEDSSLEQDWVELDYGIQFEYIPTGIFTIESVFESVILVDLNNSNCSFSSNDSDSNTLAA